MSKLFRNESLPLWTRDIEQQNLRSLNANQMCEVAIVGAGLTGLLCAYYLARSGKKVMVLEALNFLETQSIRSLGVLSINLDQLFHEMLRLHGTKKTKEIFQAQLVAQEDLINLITNEKIDCDLKALDGFLIGEEKVIYEKRFFEAQFPETSWELSTLKFSEDHQCLGLKLHRHYFLNPAKLLKGLYQVLQKYDVTFFYGTRIVSFNESDFITLISEQGFKVVAQEAILATHSALGKSHLNNRFLSYQTYAVALEIPKNSKSHGIFWHSQDKPFHFTLTNIGDKDRDIVLASGGDHRTGRQSELYGNLIELEDKVRRIFTESGKVINKWSGQIIKTLDALPIIGPFSHFQHIYVATGFSRFGFTQAHISARIVSDHILNQKNSWQKLYLPNRFNIRCTPKLINEYAQYVLQYRHYLKKNDLSSIENLSINQGKVFTDKLDFIASYKNERGHLTLKSAICPHRGGIVRWNEVENSWDCPGHGSRFSCNGDIINGPALESLNEADISPLTPNGVIVAH